MMTQGAEQLHGFALTRTLPAEPGEVFSYFTDAEKFARWFRGTRLPHTGFAAVAPTATGWAD
jgi:uncharacterized protein YndB with AHSA1/START domain